MSLARLPAAVLVALVLLALPAQAGGTRLGVAYLQEAEVQQDLASARTSPGLQLTWDVPLVAGLGHELLAAVSVGGYRAGLEPLNLLGDALLGYRFTLALGLFFDVRAGASYLHAFEGGSAAARGVAEDGVEAVRNRQLAACGALGLGWDLDRISPLPFSFFARVTGYGRRAGPGSPLPQVTSQAGLALHFG